MSDSTPAQDRPLTARPIFWVVVAAGAVILALLAVIVTLLSAPPRGDAAAPTSTQSAAPKTPLPATPTLAAVDDSTAAPEPAVIPAVCDDLYTHDLTDSFDGLVLNPAWTTEDLDHRMWSSNEAANGVLASERAVTCIWGNPAGGSDRSLVTVVAPIDVPMEASMPLSLASDGFECYEELDGVRCVSETPPSDDGQSGESHFFRDGVWIATRWSNAGPDGYTHDIVTAIFG
ncbi:hypothetical protein SAMN05428970_2558 [Agromyces sp. CF514]|nr:hypothetical protein SAMN05428970_2558 [Agromyces sp. CF514]